MPKSESVVPIETIESCILFIRGQKVMLDRDLASVYGTTTKRLNEQVKRNRKRFPADFMFTLTEGEKAELVANCDRFVRLKHSSALPHAFTEHGAIMLASVLNTSVAIEMSVFVVRAFVRIRQVVASHAELSAQFKKLEDQVGEHDAQIRAIFEVINELLAAPEPKTKRIGF